MIDGFELPVSDQLLTRAYPPPVDHRSFWREYEMPMLVTIAKPRWNGSYHDYPETLMLRVVVQGMQAAEKLSAAWAKKCYKAGVPSGCAVMKRIGQ